MEFKKTPQKPTNVKNVVSTDPLSLVATVFYPCLYLYFKNIDLVLIRDVAFMTLMFLLNEIVLFGIAYLFLRDVSKSFLIANFSMLALFTFNMLENLIRIVPLLRWQLEKQEMILLRVIEDTRIPNRLSSNLEVVQFSSVVNGTV